MRLVVKVGSGVLTGPDGALNKTAIGAVASDLSDLHRMNHDIILVSSGAVAGGVGRLRLPTPITDLRTKQACAAIGQLALMESYELAFSVHEIIPSQVLLTREGLNHRAQYLNIRNTLLKLLEFKSIPIINENDCVATDEIQFGDNDTLAAVVATKVGADKLILLTDVPGLVETDPSGQLTDRLISEVDKITRDMEKKVAKRSGSALSVGGMATKLSAAKMATAAGIETWIASGRTPGLLQKIVLGTPGVGTRFVPRANKFPARQAWIAFGRTAKGVVVVDDGALNALVQARKSLLPAGIVSVRGQFSVGDMITVKSRKGDEIGRGLVNFSAADVKKIKGHHTRDIQPLLGRADSGEVIHRDNFVLL